MFTIKNIYPLIQKSLRRRSILAILPHQSAQGKHFVPRTWMLMAGATLILAGVLYLLTTSFLVIKDNVLLKTTAYKNAVLTELVTDYRESLEDFALESAPQHAYIYDQLASWNQLADRRPPLAVGGGFPRSQTEPQSQFDVKQRALQNKASLISEADDLRNIIRDDILALQTNNKTLATLDQTIQENKRFSAALPLTWPLANGWGEIVPSSQPQLVLSTLPGTPILATAAGTVASLTRIPGQPLAWKLVLHHDFGLETTYLGVANPSVKKGETISKQLLLGTSLDRFVYQVRIARKTVPPEAYTFIRY